MNADSATDITNLKRLNRVLFIEDEGDIRHVAKMALERIGGLEVLACASGDEALRYATQFHPDLILLDVMMPGMDGPATLARLRLLPDLAATPVVFMTAKVQPSEIVHLKNLGALEVIAKPFDPLQLASRLAEIWAGISAPDKVGEDISDGLDNLRKQYAQTFDSKWQRLYDAWELAKQGDIAALQLAKQQSHTLAGSGATIGFPEVSRLAIEVERLLGLRDDHIDGENVMAVLDTLISQLRHATATSDEMSNRVEQPRRSSTPETVGKLVYLFDDDLELARALQLQLGFFGFDVETFSTPGLLEAAVQDRGPAAVVMDIVFEEGDLAGPRAIIASDAMQSRSVPVIFMSGRSDLAARLEAVRAGGSDYLTKPISVADLVERLDRLTDIVVAESYRVIVIDPVAERAEQHARILRNAGMRVTVVLDTAQVPALLGEANADLVLMANSLPGCTDIEMMAVIRQIDRTTILPVILLAQVSTEINHQSANAVLFAPFAAGELVAAVAAWCQRYREQRALMTMDGLTGLANHTLILQQLELESARARRHQYTLAVAMIDVDHFKRLNDFEGHATGDRVLASLGRFLRQRLRKTDLVGRYGGEEFMILMPETAGQAALERLDTLRQEFAAIRHFGSTNAFFITFSVGIACFPEVDGAANLSTAADRALYDAKGAGRNCVMLATDRAGKMK